MTYVREQTSEELASHMRSLQRMAGWFEPLADRLWQEVEALQETISEQAKMIEHLRGGPTPLYTAVDVTNADVRGRRSLAEHLIKQIAIEHPDQHTLLTVEHIAQWIALEAGL